MRFLAYTQIGDEPNVIVDGARTESTVLTLSHWPKSGTPAELKGDTSTASVFRYLDTPRFRVQADVVSNNHFDEDGLVGIFTLLQPALATEHRDLLLDVAQAGDFGVFARGATRHALRLPFRLMPIDRHRLWHRGSSSCRIRRWRAKCTSGSSRSCRGFSQT